MKRYGRHGCLRNLKMKCEDGGRIISDDSPIQPYITLVSFRTLLICLFHIRMIYKCQVLRERFAVKTLICWELLCRQICLASNQSSANEL